MREHKKTITQIHLHPTISKQHLLPKIYVVISSFEASGKKGLTALLMYVSQTQIRPHIENTHQLKYWKCMRMRRRRNMEKNVMN